MRTIFRSSFTWQFAGGFVLGAMGLFALQPAEPVEAPVAPVAIAGR